ncbi:hypothetical protein QJQ45_008301 [Haematococcus lacustris]|nr:hypothetical protein QJQ45_008301 [Haematococcus lacustris]
MPLNFHDNEKPREPVEFFIVNTKARPMELEGECGDVKSGRVTIAGVEAYLDKNVLVFDRDMLRNLFNEADHKKEGSLDARAIKAALTARYPKRQLVREWRQLMALLLGVPELVLAEDIKHPKVSEGTYNKESIWDGPLPELPKAPPRRPRKAKSTNPAQPPSTSAASGNSSLGSTLTSSTAQGPGELALNSMLQGSQAGSPLRSTFAASKQFSQATQGQLLASTMTNLASNLASGPLTSADLLASSSKQSVKAWGAALPPSAITLPPSAPSCIVSRSWLHTSLSAFHCLAAALTVLRTSMRSTLARKPEFVAGVVPLGSTELDLKKTLGAPLDVSMSLARVEPVRPTHVLPSAGYQEWSDYASRNCKTAPSRWFNEHPATAPPATHPYPCPNGLKATARRANDIAQEVQAENELLMTEAQLLHAIEEVLAAKMHDLEEKHQHLQAAHRQLRLDNESLEAIIEQCNMAISIARRDVHCLEAQLRKFQRRPVLTRKQRQQLQILKQTAGAGAASGLPTPPAEQHGVRAELDTSWTRKRRAGGRDPTQHVEQGNVAMSYTP